MKIGIIGYGSMGKMLLWKFSGTGIKKEDLYAANRTAEKLEEADRVCYLLARYYNCIGTVGVEVNRGETISNFTKWKALIQKVTNKKEIKMPLRQSTYSRY